VAGAGTERSEVQALVERLCARRDEIEQALLTRVNAVSDPAEVGNPEYALGLREAVGAALDYGLATLEGESQVEAPPTELLAQARKAARFGVSLDTVLRRYFAGHTLLSDCLMRETEAGGLLAGASLRELLRRQGTLFDHLVASVTEAYMTEAGRRHSTAEQRRAKRVKRLLDGELVEMGELDYPIEVWHLGILASGPEAPRVIREIATRLECRLLLVRPGGESVWAWLGSRGPLTRRRLDEFAECCLAPAATTLALGEPAHGLGGWRATHRQAAAALPVAQRGNKSLVRYADVALLAASLRDEILATTLRELYLDPLLSERDGGEALRQTARAYLGAGRNVSAAAAALGVSRTTVTARLRMIEDRIGRPPEECTAEIETALALHELGVAAGASR
jgi:hypothetical protein